VRPSASEGLIQLKGARHREGSSPRLVYARPSAAIADGVIRRLFEQLARSVLTSGVGGDGELSDLDFEGSRGIWV
jgi:hypothetical protein